MASLGKTSLKKNETPLLSIVGEYKNEFTVLFNLQCFNI